MESGRPRGNPFALCGGSVSSRFHCRRSLYVRDYFTGTRISQDYLHYYIIL